MHVNMSVKSENDDNNEKIRDYMVGGILKYLKDMTIFNSPIFNSYKRLGQFEAPIQMGWGFGNRSTTVRIPKAKGIYSRLEVRTPDTAANPYIVFTLLCEAALKGITEKIEPPKEINSNAFDEIVGETLPLSMKESLEVANNSNFLKEVLPEKLLNTYLKLKEKELEEYTKSEEQKNITAEKYFPIY